MNNHPVYEPQEDSYLLQGVVKEYVKGSVLDMGTGSGIQGMTVADKHDVTFADINPDALKQVKESLPVDAKSELILTNLFSNIKNTFDTIIFNAPYLPEDTPKDIALDGGPKGYEVTLEFLRYAKFFLNEDGIILLLISQLTKPEVVEKFMFEHGYIFEIVKKQKIAFEELLVYKIMRKEKYLLANRSFYAKGRRGLIFRGIFNGSEAIEKVRNPAAEVDTIANEIHYLEILNKHGIGPQLLHHDPHIYIREFVDGLLIEEFVQQSDSQQIREVLSEVFKQCRGMDELGINKKEMNHPHKHILITSHLRVVQIDFERCHESEKVKNVTQFLQYIVGGLSSSLKAKGIVYERENIQQLAMQYKKNMTDASFQEILNFINQ